MDVCVKMGGKLPPGFSLGFTLFVNGIVCRLSKLYVLKRKNEK
jgi:hypothetical protein